jgi:hypothetical protein
MTKRWRIKLSDREIAGKLLMRLANHPDWPHCQFCLSWAYDYDSDFLIALAEDLGLSKAPSEPYFRRLRKICRHLEAYGLLYGRVSSCHAEYIGEPKMLKSYRFGKEEYALRLAPEKHPHYKPMGLVETELKFLLDRAYPRSEP